MSRKFSKPDYDATLKAPIHLGDALPANHLARFVVDIVAHLDLSELYALAAWFVAETRLDWMKRFAQDPALLAKYEVEVLPQLSVGNVRELLRAAMPLPQLSPQEAALLVTTHLVNRTRSRKSRLKKAKGKLDTLM